MRSNLVVDIMIKFYLLLPSYINILMCKIIYVSEEEEGGSRPIKGKERFCICVCVREREREKRNDR